MATKLIAKKSSVVDKVPLTTDLDIGELAINLVDKKLYSKQADGTVVHLLPDVVNVEGIQFDTTTALANVEGLLTWNDGEGTLNLGLRDGNVTLQLGQEMVVLVKNDTALPITDGQVVYISGAAGQRPTVQLASATSEGTSSKTIGVATQTIAAGDEGYVTTSGIVNGLNTIAFLPGVGVWLSTTAGQFTTTRPTAPNHGVFVGWVVRQHAVTGSLLVHVQNGLELDELHNVSIQEVAGGDLLQYNGTTLVWENKNISSAGLATVAQGANADLAYGWGDHSTFSYLTSLALDGLTDVTITSPTTGQVLKYNGTAWVNGTEATGGGGGALDDLTDVVVTTPTTGQVLKYNGTNWVNDTDATGSGITTGKAIAMAMVFGG